MKNSFLKNGFYNTAGGIIRIGLAILTIPLLIRLIGVEEYGLWTLASSVIAIVGLAEAGLATATTVFVSQDLGKEDSDGLSQTLTVTVGAMLILATIAAFALWFGAEGIVSIFTKLDNTQQLTGVKALQIGGLVLWSRLLQQVLVGVEQAYQRYGLMNLLNTIQSALITLGMLVIAYRGGRTIALMQWQAVAAVAVLLSHAWVVQSLLKTVNLHLAWSKDKGLAVGRYSVMIWLSSLGSALFARGDRIIVGSLLGTQSLGVYAAITDITTQINVLSSLPVQPLVPAVSHLIQNLNNEQTKQNIKQAIQLNGLVALGLGGILITLSPLICSLIFTNVIDIKYIFLFCISTVIYSLYSLNAVGYYILLGIGAANICAIVVAASGFLSLIMIALGAYNFGLIGAICGNFPYLLTNLLLLMGVKHFCIPQNTLIKWLKFPLLFFCIVVCLHYFILYSNVLRLGSAILQSCILLIWFTANNKGFFAKKLLNFK
ncbi:oligosaccharide flippase family protein [Dolichospermum sp. UHCC 0684]|uniref:lipopolysaccharide biosynthesis protein n=1 Tax=unclassified Dolichospermum TaxID=2622029 RepID=UPI001444CAFD|nr:MULTISPECIES: oligosaccharide flippase family protein [unclassified Dolichospermum]MEA5531949.1 oligosaccharide flippase family protein [Dolichospermum sp. UHCC 0684]MTJ19192.1 oligosaccharide flippase family protein [Dolichospermum sp. UHCC 0299]MTJ37275.1 oligosaccharide flippase family protein [Dolichospermum sp. UHCC 0260]MTJ37773.1 oligosaccharide flippase family protein [Dolichospermum sp. UHCC 0406]